MENKKSVACPPAMEQIFWEQGWAVSKALSTFLSKKHEEIRSRNPRFSLRSFAAKIGISAGALASLIKGERLLSDSYAERIASALTLSPEERSFLFSQVRTRSRRFTKQKVLVEDELQMMTDWENYAILNLMKTDGFRSDTAWIAHRLALSEERVKRSLQLMMNLKIITWKQGSWVRNHASFTTTCEVPSKALVEAHKKDLLKAIDILQTTPPEFRSFTSVTMPISVAKISEAKELIRKFRRNLCLLMEAGSKDEVYNLNIQLYPVTDISVRAGTRP